MRPRRCAHYYLAGCENCRAYARINRQRRVGWAPAQDSTWVRIHIETLRDEGMSLQAIADRAGVSKRSVYDIATRRQRLVSQVVGQAILGVQVRLNPSCRVPAIGTARRLQALGLAGFGCRQIAEMLTNQSASSVQRWRTGNRPTITYQNHLQVKTMYEQILVGIASGRSTLSTNVATGLGYQPFDAWDDTTIDDPDAHPYQHLEEDEYVDLVKVERVRNRQSLDGVTYRFTDLTWPEQRHLFRWFLAAGGSARSFRDRYRPVPAEILRRLQEAHDEGLRLVG